MVLRWLWRLRGVIDLWSGGVGLRRGRRHPDELAVGDTVDFWRVEAYEPGRRLRLAAEMKPPGRAWLEFDVQPDGDGAMIRQTAAFDPVGLALRATQSTVQDDRGRRTKSLLASPGRRSVAQGFLTNAANLRIDRPSPAIRALAERLVAGATTPETRALACFRFVRDEIHFGFTPRFDLATAEETLAFGRGHCNPRPVLFASPLHAAGVEARLHVVTISNEILAGIFPPPGGPPARLAHTFTEVRLAGEWRRLDGAWNFFTGGLMPSFDLLAQFQRDLLFEESWRVPGIHYARTSEAWLANLDRERDAAKAVLGSVHGITTTRWAELATLLPRECRALRLRGRRAVIRGSLPPAAQGRGRRAVSAYVVLCPRVGARRSARPTCLGDARMDPRG